ncbi:MAG TPA: alpha/beta hydrolase, partial [Geminicoccaceae bacterium]
IVQGVSRILHGVEEGRDRRDLEPRVDADVELGRRDARLDGAELQALEAPPLRVGTAAGPGLNLKARMSEGDDRKRSADVADGSARTRDGSLIAYTHYRNPEARARIALAHSLAMDRSFWQPVVERLRPDASVLVHDCRGHGASDKPPGPYTVELFADDLADLLDAAGWERAAVAGASMGGCTALAFAARYPGRTTGLGLIDTTARYGEDAPAAWAGRADKALEAGLEALVGFQTERWFGDAFRKQHPEVVERCVEIFLANDPAAYAASCHMLGACDLRNALPCLRMPAAIVVGEEDYATPVDMARALHEGIRGSSLKVLEGARHLTPLERPDVVAAELRRLVVAGGPA